MGLAGQIFWSNQHPTPEIALYGNVGNLPTAVICLKLASSGFQFFRISVSQPQSLAKKLQSCLNHPT
jgi:hypothetical protein